MFFKDLRPALQDLERRIVAVEAELSTRRLELAELKRLVEASSGAELAARIDDLAAAQATARKTLQKLLGHVGGEKGAATNGRLDRDALRSAYLPRP